MLRVTAAVAALAASSAAQKITWFAASDTHFGHDVGPSPDNITTSYEKNVWAISEMNAIPNNASWPASLGGGLVGVPVAVTVSGDIIDNGIGPGSEVNGCHQWANFTSLYGFDGTDGMLKYPVLEGRGNHDGGNSSLSNPTGCSGHPSTWIVGRNKQRLATPSLNVTGVSEPTGLHYSFTWAITPTCRIHFVHMNLFPGYGCGSPMNPNGEGKSPGFPCKDGDLAWAENSLGFLADDLKVNAPDNSTMVVTIQHYGFDGFSNTWYNQDQRTELWSILNQHNPLLVLVGHTHTAGVYSFNGTDQGEWGAEKPGFIDVVNAPATQKEDGKHNALPSEFMVLEAGFASEADAAAGTGVLRVAQRVGSGWGTVLGQKQFSCAA